MSQPGYEREAWVADRLPSERPRRRMYKIVRPRPMDQVRAVVTSSQVLITRTHFQENVTYKCLGVEGGCPFCRYSIPPRTKGYLCAIDVMSGKACIVELTDNAIREHPQLREGTVDLRGKVIVLARPGRNRNSPVIAKLETCYQQSLLSSLPQPFNLLQALSAMWEIPGQGFDVHLPQSQSEKE